MLRALLLILELTVLALIAYNLLTALAGWKNPTLPAPAVRRPTFLIVIPAYNEERVIGRPIADLGSQIAAHDRLWVVADRCTDRTAERAREAGASVLEREQGPDGKGAVLRWLLDRQPLAQGEALVVIDADNRLPPDLLDRFAEEIGAGHHVMQAYLDVANPDTSPVATASALSYWASNRMVQLARTNLGWSADLGGTGMCLTAEALAAAGGFGDSLVEDQELGLRCFLAGHPVRWLHDVKVLDEKPTRAGVAVKQRSRWVRGRRQVARTWFGKLLRRGSPGALDLALRLVQPSRLGVALFSGFFAIASGLGLPLLPWPVWAAAGLIQLLAPLPFLARDGVPTRYLRRYPLLALLPLLKILARLRRSQGWYHTPHGLGDARADAGGEAQETPQQPDAIGEVHDRDGRHRQEAPSASNDQND